MNPSTRSISTVRMGKIKSLRFELLSNSEVFEIDGGSVVIEETREEFQGNEIKIINLRVSSPNSFNHVGEIEKQEDETQSNYIGRLLAGLEEEIKERTEKVMDELAEDFNNKMRMKDHINDPENYDIWGKRPKNLKEAWIELRNELLEVSNSDGYVDNFRHFAHSWYHRMLSLEYDALMREKK